jgi:hypothetical protein
MFGTSSGGSTGGGIETGGGSPIKLTNAQVNEMRNQLAEAVSPKSKNGDLCNKFLSQTIKNLPGKIKAGNTILNIFDKYAASKRGFYYAPGTGFGASISSALSRNPEIRLDFKNIKTQKFNSYGFSNSPEELVFELIHELLHGAGKGDPAFGGTYDHKDMVKALIEAGTKYGLSSQFDGIYKKGEDITRQACKGSKGWDSNNTPLDALLK